MPTKKIEYNFDEIIEILKKDSEITDAEMTIYDSDDDEISTTKLESYVFQLKSKVKEEQE